MNYILFNIISYNFFFLVDVLSMAVVPIQKMKVKVNIKAQYQKNDDVLRAMT